MRVGLRSSRLVAGCCLLLALCAAGLGQNKPHRARMTVPFDFYVGPTRFAAGQYILDNMTPLYALLRTSDGKTQQGLHFLQKKSEPEKNPRVVFISRYDRYYFSTVWCWFGRLQFTGFNPHENDEFKEVPITPAE